MVETWAVAIPSLGMMEGELRWRQDVVLWTDLRKRSTIKPTNHSMIRTNIDVNVGRVHAQAVRPRGGTGTGERFRRMLPGPRGRRALVVAVPSLRDR